MMSSQSAPLVASRPAGADPLDDLALAALLRLPDDGEIDETRLARVIAATGAAAGRTPQRPPPLTPGSRVARWLDGWTAFAQNPLWRYGVPATVGLVLGVLVGQASVDRLSPAQAPPTVDSLIAASHAVEPFGL